jgi:taurine dioxygenase
MEAKLELRPLFEDLGVEVTGYDFDHVLGEDTVRRLRQTLLDHHLLLFRGRTLDPARQIAFTLLFGSEVRTCSPRNRFLPGFPEIVLLGNREGEVLSDIRPYWHSDGAHLSEPAAVSIHHAIVATEDGDTLYTSLGSAYERLPPEGRRHVSRMRTRSQTGITHPLVLPHPVTGRLGIYVNLDHNAAIIDEFGHENRAMRDGLERHLCAEGTYYRHRWRAGDMLVIDNFAASHRPTRPDPAAPRVVHRTSIHGSSAWWRNSACPIFRAGALMAS